MVIIEEAVFKTQRPHHFNICCWSDRGEPCCLVKVLDILKLSSTPPCGPPQGSSFKIFQISHCPGPSNGYHIGHFFIWLTNEKSPNMVLKLSVWWNVPKRKRENAFDNDYDKKEVEQGSLWNAYLQSKESKLKQTESQKVFQQSIDRLASLSIESRVTLREGITAEGSLEPLWSPHFPNWGFWNDLGEIFRGSWAARCQEGSLNGDASLPAAAAVQG